MVEQLFKNDNKLEGLLIGLIKEPNTYLIRFPYTKGGIRKINFGGYIAVENFYSEAKIKRYSVLEMTKVSPVHYALGSKPDKLIDEYYGFVEVAARSLSRDWEQEEPEEDVTRIQVEGTPIKIMIEKDLESGTTKFLVDPSSPLLGATARILTDEAVSFVVNRGIKSNEGVEFGYLLANRDVPLRLNASELCKSHVGLFGFTRSGKSNLASNLIESILRPKDSSKKAIVIDYTNEYFGLLADCFDEVEDSLLLVIDTDRLRDIGQDFNQVLSDPGIRKNFAEKLVSNMTLQDLEEHSEALIEVMDLVLERGGVKAYVPLTLKEEASRKLKETIVATPREWLGKARRAILSWPDAFRDATIDVKPDLIKQLSNELLDYCNSKKALALHSSIKSDKVDEIIDSGSIADGITATQQNCIRDMVETLNNLYYNWLFFEKLDLRLKIGLVQLSKTIDDKSNRSLIVATSEKTDDLALFFSDLVNYQYKQRRRTGTKDPSVLFFVDEADEFMPQESVARGVRADSRKAAEMLARRSGKFAMGIGLATQRVAYMDTKVMGQLHTYFVSKLPRRSDRAKVAEAFGIEIDSIDRTLQLNTGEWVVISHSALGIPITPFLAKFPNAVDRVVKFLQTKGYLST